MQNLAELLQDTATRLPGHPAVMEAGRTWTYTQLWQEVCVVADRLESVGIGVDRMVGLQLGNGAAFIVLSYALWRCGAVVVPMPRELQGAEREDLIRAMDLAAIIALDAPPGAEASARIAAAGVEVRVAVLHTRRAAVKDKLNAALVRFTSGTTNTNKGVVLTHEGILDRITAANRVLGIGPEDRIFWCLPMVHHFVVTIILYLRQGAGIVLAQHAAPGDWLPEIVARGVTVLYASPFHYDALSQDTSGQAMSSVRLAVSTTTALPADVATRFFERYGAHLVQAYGIIELGLSCINVDDPAQRPTSVGRPVPGFSVRLANADQYAALGAGYGEIEIAGPGFFAAYFHPWTPAAAITHGPWFHTGDVGRVDAEGFVFLHSRVNSVIHVAGMKVFPEDVEHVLDAHAAVRESRVFGARHAHLGEVVEAEVVLREGATVTVDELRQHCARRLSALKVPNRIRFVGGLDRTLTTQKIKRHRQPEAPS